MADFGYLDCRTCSHDENIDYRPFLQWTAAFIEPFAHEDLTGLLDDIGKTLFVLCAVSFLIAFAFIYSALFSIILIKLLTR